MPVAYIDCRKAKGSMEAKKFYYKPKGFLYFEKLPDSIWALIIPIHCFLGGMLRMVVKLVSS